MDSYVVYSKDRVFITDKDTWTQKYLPKKSFSAIKAKTREEALTICEEKQEQINEVRKNKKDIKDKKDNNKKRKRNTQRQFVLSQRKIPEIDMNSSNYLAFYDSEWNARDYCDGIPEEIVSVGLVIMDICGVFVDGYYSTIRLKEAQCLTKRCEKITGLCDYDLNNASSFPSACKHILHLVNKYNINKIYVYGNADGPEFRVTANLYREIPEIDLVAEKICDVHDDFENLFGNDLYHLGLTNLKRLCEIPGEVTHNALQDAKDIGQIYYHLSKFGYSREILNSILKERKDKLVYKNARKIKDSSISASKEVIDAKNILIDFLRGAEKEPELNVDPIIIRALEDDLNDLIKEKKEG